MEEEKEVIRNVKVNMNDVEYSVNNKIVEMCRFSDKNIPKDVFETMLFFAEIIIRVGEEPFLQLSKPLGDIITQNEMKKIQTIDKQILINLLSYSTDTNIPALHNFICYTLWFSFIFYKKILLIIIFRTSIGILWLRCLLMSNSV